MKNIKNNIKKNHSKKEHDAHVNDTKKLDPASVKQEQTGLTNRGGCHCGKRFYPEAAHKNNK